MLKETVLAFVNDGALSRGAAIAFYTVTSIAPILLIVIAVAGLVFSRETSQGAIISQMSGLMGQQTADVLQTAIAGASANHRASEASAKILTTCSRAADFLRTQRSSSERLPLVEAFRHQRYLTGREMVDGVSMTGNHASGREIISRSMCSFVPCRFATAGDRNA